MQRLCRKTDIQRVLREGRRFHSQIAVLHARRRSPEEAATPGPRLAVIAGRRFRTAVRRNRARRVLREVFRVILQGVVSPWDLILVARTEALDQPYDARRQTLVDLLSQAGILSEEAIAPA